MMKLYSDVTQGRGLNRNLTFCICASCIFFFFILFSFLQELIFKSDYKDLEGKIIKFAYPSLALIASSLFSYLLASFYLRFIQPPTRVAELSCDPIPKKESVLLGVLNFVTALMSYSALLYVSYPTKLLATSTKAVPIILFALFGGIKRYTKGQYLLAFTITLGQCLYYAEKMFGTERNDNIIGLGLLIGSLIVDGCQCWREDKLTETYNISSIELMKTMNFYTCMFSIALSFVQYGPLNILEFVTINPHFLFYFMLIGTAGALGQLFIFITLVNFGSLMVSIICALRKFGSVVLSVIYYGHSFSLYQAQGAIVIGLALLIDVGLKAMDAKKTEHSKGKRRSKHRDRANSRTN